MYFVPSMLGAMVLLIHFCTATHKYDTEVFRLVEGVQSELITTLVHN